MGAVSQLEVFFRPKSVAVVGASSDPKKPGYTALKNMISLGYKGKIYPINPRESHILDLPCYKSVLEIKAPVDACVLLVAAELSVRVAKDIAEKRARDNDIQAVVCMSAGFSELHTEEAVQREKDLVGTLRGAGIRLIGPNCLGVMDTVSGFNTNFDIGSYPSGGVSVLTQSGAFGNSLLMWSGMTGLIGLNKYVSIGNMSDVDFADIVGWLDSDPNTSCITLYIEGFKDGRAFIEAARKASKPIIALKAGVSAHGAAAAASHTGSLAGAAKVYGAALQQAGVIQATDLDNLFDRTLALSLQSPMKGDNLLIITNGGGVGVLATDAAEKYGLPLKFAPADVQAELKKHMPEFGSAKNPVDLTGMAGNEWYGDSVRYSYAHPWTEGVVVLYCETAITDPMQIAQAIKKAVVDSGVTEKPITVSFVGGERSAVAMRWLVENGIPAYGAPDVAVDAIASLREFARMKALSAQTTEPCASFDRDVALEVIRKARADGRDSLTEIEAKEVFSAYGMPVTSTELSKSEDEAVALAKKIGYPVVMKIVSPDILHKSDAGGVKVNLKDEAGVRDAFKTIMKNAKAYKASADIHGVAVQEMAPWGTEVILGSVNDPTFGPTMMFGLGGIFVEVLKDVTFRVAPVADTQARRMLDEIRGAPILAGVRGEEPRDRKALSEVICQYSSMIIDLKDEIAESDANPVLVYEVGAGLKVVDARIILKKK